MKAPKKKKKLPVKVKKTGRPSKYSKEIADRICEMISASSKGLSTICKLKSMPSFVTVYSWLNNPENDYFLKQYTRAREAQAEFLADEIIEIADTARKGTKTRETKDGLFKETGDMVDRSRLMIDARKWKASKLAPKKYGDKIDVTTGGESITPKQDLSKLTTEELLKLHELNTKLGN